MSNYRAGSIEAELALKINEIVEFYNILLPLLGVDTTFGLTPKAIKEIQEKDSLGCNTLPEGKCCVNCKTGPYCIAPGCKCHTLPEEKCNGFHYYSGGKSYPCGDFCKKPKHNHENNVSSTMCGECQREKNRNVDEYLMKEQKVKELIKRHSLSYFYGKGISEKEIEDMLSDFLKAYKKL